MWQPPERIKYKLPDPGWPTEDQAARSRLFSKVAIGPIEAEQRTWVPAMVPWRATEEGHVTDDVIDWYRRFAEGRPGVIVVEATGIRDIPSGPLLRIGHDRFLPGLRRLVDAVREGSQGHTRLFIQCIDFLTIRRRPPKKKYFDRFLQLNGEHRDRLSRVIGELRWRDPAKTPEAEVRHMIGGLDESLLAEVLTGRELEDLHYGYRERVWDTHLPHIRDLPRVLPGLFANAAERAFAAGFDGVELHYAHAYTMASFLSALNTRDDGYGGVREHRARLPLEVIAAVRDRVGRDRVVGVRYLGDDVIEGGSRLDDAVYFGVCFAGAGLDYLSISKGGKFEDAKQPKVGEASYPYTGRSGYECMPTIYSDEIGPFARNVPLAAAIKRAVNRAGYHLPVVTAGGIGSFAQAEAILQRGEADIIASARQALADPDWFLKMRLGRGQDIRRCEFTNYCEALDQKHKQVTCKLWDRVDLDGPGVKLDATGRRRLVAPPWKPE
ncbi:MAG: NADH:flavin oxidoreductase [Proteobacteria bacterium]|nr:NADH:flavin oxidoreductase [Pseudomonadota bacterium]